VLYVDDTLCAGERKEVEWAYKKIEEKIKIVKLGRLKKHLGIIYEWKQNKSGYTYLEASMPKMIDEIREKFEQARGKKVKEYATPGTPGKTLKKNEGDMVDIDAYRSIERRVGYLASEGTKLLCLRKPRVLQSISYCDSDYAKDENDRKSISGR
jgi:hypothetical protein